MEVRKVGIIGLGELGNGLVRLIALKGYAVQAVDKREERLIECKRWLEESGRRKEGEEWHDIASKVGFSTEIGGMRDCELVIEAIGEDLEAKQKLLRDLEEVTSHEAILGTTTSCHSVTGVARRLIRAERVVGMHFIRPVERVKLVELVRGEKTKEALVEIVDAFCRSLEKETIVVKDLPGLLVNYLFVPYMNQAIEAYDQGLASREDLDTAIRMGLGYPMGPLELIDLIGLDKHLELTSALYDRLGDRRFFPPPILRRMVDAGKLGRKTGEGFYRYEQSDRT
jgi:3-hydroxybutyryl-CoA dehydrogenase